MGHGETYRHIRSMDDETVHASDLVPLKESGELFPLRGGRPVSLPTLWRWAQKGSRGRKLKTVTVGGMKHTCRQWVDAFVFSEEQPEATQ